MINHVTLIGNVGADPEIKNIVSGIVAKFSLATTDNWLDRQGEWQSKTQWHRITAFGKVAEYIDRYIQKGQQVYVFGSIEYGSYTNRDGIKVYTTEIKARKVKILGRKDENQKTSTPAYQPPAASSMGSDVPF